jgi:hypothetical protein
MLGIVDKSFYCDPSTNSGNTGMQCGIVPQSKEGFQLSTSQNLLIYGLF